MDCRTYSYKLSNGVEMPFIGFGTFQIRGKQLIKEVLDYALAAGYRSIDTAAVYGNEQDIGLALKDLLQKYNLKREDIFITSKLSPSEQGHKAFHAIENSLKNLQCNYLDLYLIHWPGVAGLSTIHPDNAKLRSESWLALAKAQQKGLVRSIGVSNYTVKHLTELLSVPCGMKPVVNQVEWHPHCHQTELKKFCEQEAILLQAYSSLGGTNNKSLITDPTVVSIAQKLNKTAAQVLLRWAVQQEVAIIPKARSKQRISENIDLNFVISSADLLKLNCLKTSEKYAWDPSNVK